MNRLSWRRFERLKVSVALCAPTACKCNRLHLPSRGSEGEGKEREGGRRREVICMEYSNLINNSPRFLELCPEGWRREVVFETRERGRGHSRVTVVSLFTEAARKGAHPWLISGYRYRIIAALSKDEFWWTFAPNISTPTPPPKTRWPCSFDANRILTLCVERGRLEAV